ncbi:hypothetical protein CHS0354_013084 [Potamilus streckersoni]|uniref:XK-related protein n=1 Tax=Potamilus streckersoni TaxID=2493646 RepID=A0AAE0SFI8_9BIVA|nr:hypothetical protein CHS0354_013084 [Potamilus streckersoni]
MNNCRKTSPCFIFYVGFSLLIYLAKIIMNGLFVHYVYLSSDLHAWFTVTVGLLLLPLVTVQLMSAILLLRRKGEKLGTCSSAFIAVLHVLQLGIVWRHVGLIFQKDIQERKLAQVDLSLLQIYFVFSSTIPLLVIQVFFCLFYSQTNCLMYTAIGITLSFVVWALTSFKKQQDTFETESIALVLSGTVFRLLWRLGEIVCRILSLTVFATVYQFWVFLILSLHWLTIMICISTTVFSIKYNSNSGRCQKFLISAVVSWLYTFCYISFSSERSAVRYITYYSIMLLENAILTAVWYIATDKSDDGTVANTIVFISSCSFFIGVVSLGIYYRFFHVRTSSMQDEEKKHVCFQNGCINCRLSLCSKHNIKLQRPFNAGWTSQYQQALVNGHYYKNLQDSIIDSLSEWELDSKSADSLSQEGASINGCSCGDKKQTDYISVQGIGTYTHRRFFEKTFEGQADNIINDSDSASMTSIEEEQCSCQSVDTDSTITNQDKFTLSNSQTQLLTESWDDLLQKSAEKLFIDTKQFDTLRSLISRDIDCLSEGYSTDHTLDSYQLPITVLAKNKRDRSSQQGSSKRSLSIASSSTSCTICDFMMNHLNAVAKAEKGFEIHVQTPGNELQSELKPDPLKVKSNEGVLNTSWTTSQSDSGDSAFPRETPISSCMGVTDEEGEGDDTSLEMII